MLASVIIPTSGDSLRLEWTLESLTRQNDQNFEVIVVNDAGLKRCEKLIVRYSEFFGERLLYDYLPKDGRRFRAALARNHGVRLSQGDVLIFLDEDCPAFPDMISQHCSVHTWNHLVQGLRLRLSLDIIRAMDGDFSYRWLFDNARMAELTESMTISNLFSFNFSMDAKSFCRIGGFDEDYVGWGGEDIDLGYRLKRMGFSRSKMGYEGAVIHLDHPIRKPNTKWRELFFSRIDGPIERNGGRLVRLNV